MCASFRIALCLATCIALGLCLAAPAQGQWVYLPGTWYDQDKPNVAGDHWTRNCYNDSNNNGEFDPGEPWNGTQNTPDPSWTRPKVDQVDNSCWAASASNLLRYAGGPSRYIAWVYSGDSYGGRTWQDGGLPHRALTHDDYHADDYLITDQAHDDLPDKIAAHLRGGLPVSIGLQWDPGGGHAITCYAIDLATNQVWLADSDGDETSGDPNFFTATVVYNTADDDWELSGYTSTGHDITYLAWFEKTGWQGSGVGDNSDMSGSKTLWSRATNWTGLGDPGRKDQLLIEFTRPGIVNVDENAVCGKLMLRGADPQLNIDGTRLNPTALQAATGDITLRNSGHLDVEHEIAADCGLSSYDSEIDAGGNIYLGYDNTPDIWFLRDHSTLNCDTLYLGYRSARSDGATGNSPQLRVLSGSSVDTSVGIVNAGLIYSDYGEVKTSGDLVNHDRVSTYNGSLLQTNDDLINRGGASIVMTGSNLYVVDDFILDGTVELRDTAGLCSGDAYVGPNASAQLIVRDPTGILSVGNLTVGDTGHAESAQVYVSGGASLIVRGDVNLETPGTYLSIYSGSDAEIRGDCTGPKFFVRSGSALEIDGNFIIGQHSSPASLTIEDSTVGVHTHMTFAHTHGGTMEMSDSTLTVDRVLTLGHLDHATVEASHSTIVADSLYIGRYATAEANMTATEINCETLRVGYDHDPSNATELTLRADGGVDPSVTISGASASAVFGTNGQAVVNQYAGSFDAAHVPVTLASNTGSSATYSLRGGAFDTGDLTVGRRGTATFTQRGGNVEVFGELTMAEYAGSTGTYNLNGGTAVVHNFAAGAGDGTLNIDGGTLMLPTLQVEVQELNIGNAMFSDGDFFLGPRTLTVDELCVGKAGHGRLDAQNSHIFVAGDLHVGVAQNYYLPPGGSPVPTRVSSSLEQQGGDVHATQVFLGTESGIAGGGWGIYDMDGGSLETDYLFVGHYGEGRLNQYGDSTINTRGTCVGFAVVGAPYYPGRVVHTGGTHQVTEDLSVGHMAGAIGYYTLGGASSDHGTLTVGEMIRVGFGGIGTFSQSGLGAVTADGLIVGGMSSAVGVYTQSGGTTQIDDHVVIGQEGVGSYTIGNTDPFYIHHGALDVRNKLYVGLRGRGSFTQVGHAEVTADYIVVGSDSAPATPNTYRLEGGTAHAAEDLDVGEKAGSYGEFYLAGADLNTVLSTDDTDVGAYGEGKIFHQGGLHETDHLRLGQRSGGNGRYDLTGGELHTGDTAVGHAGSGTFNHTGGLHQVTADLFIGREATGTGTYTLSGTSATEYGHLSVGDTLYVGYDGAGVFYLRSWRGLSVDGHIDVGKLGRISSGSGDKYIAAPVVNNGRIDVDDRGDSLTFLEKVSGSGRFTGEGEIVFEGGFSPGSSIAAADFEGDVTFGPQATLEIELDYTAKDDDTAKDLVLDYLTIEGTASLGGTLNLRALGSLEPGGRPWGDLTAPIISAGEVSGTFTLGSKADDFLGYGVFLTDEGASGRRVSYSSKAVAIDVLQAADGDTDGDRLIGGGDIENILAANLFGVPNPDPPANWKQGDFTGDGKVGGDDIQSILAANLFNTGPYAAMDPGAPGEANAELLITPDGLMIDPHGTLINGYVITSAEGVFTGEPADNLGLFHEDTDAQISGNFAFALDNRHLLGDVIGDGFDLASLLNDLTFTYTVAGQSGVYGGMIAVPEPSTLILLGNVALGLLLCAWRRRRRAVSAQSDQ